MTQAKNVRKSNIFPDDLANVSGEQFRALVAACGGTMKVAAGLGVGRGALAQWFKAERVDVRNVRALRDFAQNG